LRRQMLIGKIHRATITGADVDYEGSITLDPDLMDAAGLIVHERVSVLDIDNGSRFDTYAIAGIRGKGEVVVNGAAARLVQQGDKCIVLAYGEMEDEEARAHEPNIVLVGEGNRPVTITDPV